MSTPLAERARRAFESCLEARGEQDPLIRRFSTALDRHCRPFDLRIVGGLGSGRRGLAAAVAERRAWVPDVADVDVLAGRPGPAPDAEVLCLCTAPCRHEELWRRRPRRHPLYVVATAGRRWVERTPDWARGLPTIAVDGPHATDVADSADIDVLVETLDVVQRDLPRHRDAILADTLAEIAAQPSLTSLVEPALAVGRSTGTQ